MQKGQYYAAHKKISIIICMLYKGRSESSLSLKHKDSFVKSENLSKIFFWEILVFDHDYEGISSSSNDLLWITFIFLNNLFELFFELFGGPPNKSMHIYNIKSISIFCMV